MHEQNVFLFIFYTRMQNFSNIEAETPSKLRVSEPLPKICQDFTGTSVKEMTGSTLNLSIYSIQSFYKHSLPREENIFS